MTKLYDFSQFFTRALQKRDMIICTKAAPLLFPDGISADEIKLDYKPGRCFYIDDLSVWCRGKLLMSRKSKTKTGFTQIYESPIFKTKTKSKSK